MTPGPDSFLVLRTAARSRKHAIAAVAGISSALIVWTTLAVSGAALVITTHPEVLAYIKIIGGAWLLWMAYNFAASALAQFRSPTPQALADPTAVLGSLASCYRQGLATNLSNPKAVLYFAAIVAPLIPVGAPWWVHVLYVVAIIAESAIVFSLIAFFVSTARVRRRLVAAGPWIDAAAAVLFVIVSIGLISGGLGSLLG